MKYNVHRTVITEESIDFLELNILSEPIVDLLSKIQIEMVNLYQTKQVRDLGVKSLGNEIRYSKELNKLFENSICGAYIIRFTENNRYFLSKFIDVTMNVKEKEIFFLILNNEFGKESKLVDNSFIRINQVKTELVNFFEFYKAKIELPQIYFIEMTAFSNYFFEERNGFKFIHKIK
jgi:hypothetical protein